MNGWIGVIIPAVAGVAFVGLGVPLFRRQIPRNSWYGYRIGETMSDDDTWFAVNERGGRHMIILGSALLFLAAIGLIFAGRDRTQEDLTILAAIAALGGISWSALNCLGYARELSRAKRLSDR